MKNCFLLLLLMLTFGFVASAQQITYAEYYIDAPVQNGSGISIPITQNGDSISPSFTIPSTGLSSGLHHISIRVRNSLGDWSIIENRQFTIQEADYPALNNAPLKSFEYYFDADLNGIGNNTKFSFSNFTDSVESSFTFSTVGLNKGLHTIYYRFQDSLGKWSLFEGRNFIIQEDSYPTEKTARLKSFEYYIDNDVTGQGSYQRNSLIGNLDSVQSAFNLSSLGLSEGNHTLYIRFLDSLGRWSLFEGRNFQVMNHPISKVTSGIVAAEYYKDSDPGVGNGNQIFTRTIPVDSLNDHHAISTLNLSAGIDSIFVRVKDSTGIWSLPKFVKFELCANSPAKPVLVGDSISYSCKGIKFTKNVLALSGANTYWRGPNSFVYIGDTLQINQLNATHFGRYYIYKVKGSTGCDTSEVKIFDLLESTPINPLKLGVVSPQSICSGDTIKLISPVTGNFNYLWYKNQNKMSSDTNTNSELIVFNSGNYGLQIKTPNACIYAMEDTAITFNPRPNLPIILGKSEGIVNGKDVFTSSLISLQHNWFAWNGNIISRNDSNSVAVQWPNLAVNASIKLVHKNNFGCQSDTGYKQVGVQLPYFNSDSVFLINSNTNKLNIPFQTNSKWKVTSNQTWLQVTKDSIAMVDSFQLNIDANNLAIERSGFIRVENEFSFKLIRITQAPMPYFNSDSVFLINSNNKKLNIPFQTNSKWKITSNQSWMQVTKDSIAMADSFQINIDANNLAIERSGFIRVENEFSFKLIRITQSPMPYFNSDTVFLINSNNKKLNIPFQTNSKWKITSNQSWMQVTKDSIAMADSFQINIDANNLTIERSGLIRVENGFLFKLIRITQSAATGKLELWSLPEIKIFPNPNLGYLTIENIPESIEKVSLTDITGRTILQDLAPKFGVLHIDIHEFPDASYCLVFEDSWGVKHIVKIIKTTK
jgi:uncharacterized beta-barrel protein YwiB (DUF1934 family)